MRRAHLESVVFLALLAGCSSQDSAPESVIQRDSAGVRIIEFASLEAERALTLSAEPVVSLGVVAGNPAQEFDNIRSALVLSDSTIAVVNGGTNEIRFFDRRGNHTRSVGGTGDGPGEYQGLSHVSRAAGDTILAFDRWLQRVTMLNRNGDAVASYRLPFEGASRVDRLAGGSFIPTSFLVGMGRGPRGVHADTGEVVRYDIANAIADTVLDVTTLEWFSHGDELPPTPLPWGRTTFIAADGESIHIVQSDRFELRTHDANGRLTRIVRTRESARPVDDRAYEAMRAAWLTPNPASRSSTVDLALLWSDLPRPDYMPELTAIQVEDHRIIWVERYEPDPTRDRVWFGFADGEALNTLRIRAGLRVLDISAGHVIVRRTDEMGVQYVDVHAMIDARSR